MSKQRSNFNQKLSNMPPGKKLSTKIKIPKTKKLTKKITNSELKSIQKSK